MINRPYPSYKCSGVAWLGEIPENWEVSRLDFHATVKARLGWKGLTADEYVPEGYIFLATPNIKGQGDIDFTNVNYISSERYFESPEIMIQIGDVLIAKDGSTLGITNVVKHLPAPATVNSSIAIIRSKVTLDSVYLFRWLTSEYMQHVIQSLKDGQGVPHLFQADIKKFTVLIPPLDDQQCISNFLDCAIEKVDLLIGKKRELIERLKEKRTALISHVVTKGLPPEEAAKHGLPVNPRLKPSGVTWLGDVPEHWAVTPLRYLFKNLDRRRIPVAGEDRATMDKVYPYYGASGIIDHVEEYLFDETLILVAEDGANLLSRSSPLAFLATGKYWVNNHAHILEPRSGSMLFWVSVLQTFDYTPLVTGAAQPKLTADRLGSILLPNPPPEEQKAISDFIATKSSLLDELTGCTHNAVEKLLEYRSALITAAVTGKIDVCEEVTA